MNILSQIKGPSDLKKLSQNQLEQLCEEIRSLLITTTSHNGGHLASSLGVVELTVALHRVFESPKDKIVWDVGHQAYAHKLLTGRLDSFSTIRQYHGLSGFPVRNESPHDAFGTGHAGTSVSAALGMALARDLSRQDYNVIAVIGDGSLGAGMAFEAINHAGQLGTRIIVILNDNGISISPTIGALSRILNRMRFSHGYETTKVQAKKTITQLPFGKQAWSAGKQVKYRAERALLPTFWPEMGFVYLGPVDGHNIQALESALSRAKHFESGPVLIHAITQKGKGHQPAEDNPTRYHGVSPESVIKSGEPSYSKVFGEALSDLMREDKRVVAITAAMLDGTGLSPVATEFPDRVFDVGICEQHAVTLAAGLTTQGYIPVVAIYSTFLQRSYDQIIHDVCLQNLPVIFAIDRAGIVGDDGKTHQGAFDISYLRLIPNMAVAAPKDKHELQAMLRLAVQSGQPVAIRYPRGSGMDIASATDVPLRWGKGEILREGQDVAILALGSTVSAAMEASEQLAEAGISCTVANARFAKPLDEELVQALCQRHGWLITVEENAVAGGFGSAVLESLSDTQPTSVRVTCLGIPDTFVEHGTQECLRAQLKLDAKGIVARVLKDFPVYCHRGNS